MIKGTHNTMSYLPVRQWWLRPFRRFGKCQDKDIFQQWESGVRYFDLRVRFNADGQAVFAHGLLDYETGWSPDEVVDILCRKAESSEEQVYIRVLLECMSAPDEDTKSRFFEFIKWCGCIHSQNPKFSWGVKTPFDIWVNKFDRPFIEVAEWINTPLKFLRTPRWYVTRGQAVSLNALGDDYEGIVSMDFV